MKTIRIEDFPIEIFFCIFDYLSIEDIIIFSTYNNRFFNITKNYLKNVKILDLTKFSRKLTKLNLHDSFQNLFINIKIIKCDLFQFELANKFENIYIEINCYFINKKYILPTPNNILQTSCSSKINELCEIKINKFFLEKYFIDYNNIYFYNLFSNKSSCNKKMSDNILQQINKFQIYLDLFSLNSNISLSTINFEEEKQYIYKIKITNILGEFYYYVNYDNFDNILEELNLEKDSIYYLINKSQVCINWNYHMIYLSNISKFHLVYDNCIYLSIIKDRIFTPDIFPNIKILAIPEFNKKIIFILTTYCFKNLRGIFFLKKYQHSCPDIFIKIFMNNINLYQISNVKNINSSINNLYVENINKFQIYKDKNNNIQKIIFD